MKMYENFTNQARNALNLAIDEARSLNHYLVGTEHILLGLMRDECVARRALEGIGLSRSAVLEFLGLCEATPIVKPVQFEEGCGVFYAGRNAETP